MATVTQRPVREATQDHPPGLQRRQGSWRWRRSIVAAGVLTVAIVFLPTIAARTPLARWLVAKAAADLDGTASVASLRLGWLSAPVVDGIEIRDRQDRPLVQVKRVRTERSLLGLLLNPKRVGRIVVERPVVHVVYDGVETNLEEVFSEWIHGEGSAFQGIDVELEVAGATLALTDARSNESWQVDSFDLKAVLPASAASPATLKVQGQIADQRRAGRIDIGASWRQAVESDDPLAALESLEMRLEGAPLGMLAPLVAKAAPETELGGQVDALVRCEATSEADQSGMAIEASVTVDGLVLAGPALRGDRLVLDRVESTGRATWRGSLVKIDLLRVETGLGNLLVSGGFDLADQSLAAAARSLTEQTYHVEGSVDLPALAASLPRTLRLQEGTRIESGSATVVFGSRRQGEGMRWDGRFELSRLSGVRQGRRVSWPEPILATLAASKDGAGLSIERLECRARHFRFDASGTPQKLAGSADFHLAALAEEASQLIDLGRLKIAGDGHGRFEWRREGASGYSAEAAFQMKQFVLASGDQPEWSEPELSLAVNARGRRAEGEQIELESAGVEVRAGDDQAIAGLAAPVGDLRGKGPWPIEFRVTGDLARLEARARPLLPRGDWRLAGRFTASGKLTCEEEQATLTGTRIELEGLALRGPRLNFQESKSELVVGSAQWRWKDHRLDVPSVVFSGARLGVGLEPLRAAWSRGELSELDATVAVRTTLERVQEWATAREAAQPAWLVRGRLAGRATVRTDEGKLRGEAEAAVEDFSALHASGRRFAEPAIRFAAAGSYDLGGGVLQLDRLKLDSNAAAVEVAGNVAWDGPAARLALDGQCRYDVARLSELGRAQFGVPIYAAGQETSPVSYRGPLALAEAEARFGLAWAEAEIVGFRFGPGELATHLSGGVLRGEPLEVDVSEGRLHVVPQVRFGGEGAVLEVGGGRLADQVRISPQMCAGALQYIAPPLAGVASAEGKFSIDLDECRIPLDFPERGSLAGRMTVHSVAIGPGPLVHQLATAVGLGGTAQLSRESTVPFRMVQGRVYHRDLQLVFNDVTVTTHGSVGLDQSLALVVEMPVPAKWRTGNATLDLALKNQTIRLPVGGSLLQPAIDKRELERQAGQFLQGAARNVIGNELNRQLERLLQQGGRQ